MEVVGVGWQGRWDMNHRMKQPRLLVVEEVEDWKKRRRQQSSVPLSFPHHQVRRREQLATWGWKLPAFEVGQGSRFVVVHEQRTAERGG